jgi:hypothetical protein
MNLTLPQRLLEAYAVANTPAFLFKALRDAPYVMGLRDTYTFDELLENLERRDRSANDLTAIVSAYCQALAAFGLTNDPMRQLKVANALGLPWADRLLALHRAGSSVTNGSSTAINISRPSTRTNEFTFGARP